ncbi:transmembrane protein, putative (macronuclear) [Tetrahymena thermophila SB210]|uniref:Transmembrane protein, putative n=1 Tax=Tetrahymena thermophila (strain SB210) TaxID=312017 RepID=W7WZP9_TETTS|nr:transmembrane protein, putative [Tetrahymena thermophila SB210]EWS71077.1 transmembrane protein, putative [Tetrahymena thermophila SB210]|eukprot:XP_012656376.1 transmembrane protein, putative [Tetrahymena thermophila SB210]
MLKINFLAICSINTSIKNIQNSIKEMLPIGEIKMKDLIGLFQLLLIDLLMIIMNSFTIQIKFNDFYSNNRSITFISPDPKTMMTKCYFKQIFQNFMKRLLNT